ncbi:hypothetical protein P4U99_03505 [Brevibacillus agri]|uniref:hypothetical protein n=1 Tax=Bacillota TaxID=1239 RepID=UPI00027199CA|nr:MULTISPECIES: hypothetical protein [Bacillota]EJL40199.1 hypothetical protein PMI08_04586 [Brevibacillus sp. CF112]MBG9567577.1 hypothetical protein [Brevibacillus agri]MBY0055033.1 hypothetical protein [Brevibacillus agri]MDN4094982.1 hypothetical protein [Brevibacillus agri]MDR9505282.1 hypothetical protein [Brevibacillus agri]
MKRKLPAFLVVAMSAELFLSSVEVSAREDNTIPQYMLPGTVLIYDDNLQIVVEKGGYPNFDVRQVSRNLDGPHIAKIPEDATEEEARQIELENELAIKAFQMSVAGDYIQAPLPEIYPGMKVVYDEVTGELNNIYYADENDPSGYSLHNEPVSALNRNANSKKAVPSAASNVQWKWGKDDRNVLTYQAGDDSFLGTGRATYFTGSIGNRDNKLKNYDCATHKEYDYSKKGDKDITIRNLDTDKAFTFYQASVGTLPDAIIDIWGLSNLQTVAGNTRDTSVPNVRYYHKRFSDQSIPR